jgi:UDP-N-acetylglucosamine acyltransferase
MAEGHPAKIIGLNIEGLRRRGVTKDASLALKQTYRYLFREHESRLKAYELIVSEKLDQHPIVSEFVEFVKKTDQGRHGRALEAQRAEVPPEERDGALSVKKAGS